MASAIHAIILADDPLSRVQIAGLTARERGIRVARRVGATTIDVVDSVEDRAKLSRIAADRSDVRILVIRVDQLVHTPLVAPLVGALADRSSPEGELGIAVGSDGAYAGALFATGAAARAVVTALASGMTDVQYVAIATESSDSPTVTRVPHGEIARHAIGTRDERRAAHRLLYRILIKPQDNPITRFLFRPVSFPLTRMLAWTPITPNQISFIVAALGVIGCYLTAHASFNYAIAGTACMLVASYVDCCDGEIARVKLLSSKYGAWIDTVIDELSTMGYMVCLGYHCYLHYGQSYYLAAALGSWVLYAWGMYAIYYNIIVGVGSANSQDYVGRFDVVPGEQPNTVRLKPHHAAAKQLPPALAWLTHFQFILRRDFIVWATMIMALAHITNISFGIQVLGGVCTAPVLALDHLRLRSQRRSIVRAGQTILPAN